MADDVPVLQPQMLVAETYEVERLIGRGGMGEVWSANHRRLPGKQVALKVLRLNQQAGGELLARFRREAEIAARLSHPNIVEVLDYNTLSTGQPYIVMELLRGESLAERLKRGPMSFETLQPIARQVGAALEAAHAMGVVHRDLKPENIFLVPTALGDQVKVLDFGISKLAESGTLQTTDAVLIGTPLYMSPEQALGHNRDVSAQSDVFSLGSICYEALSGSAPFAAPSIAQVVFKIAYEAPPSVSESVEGLPAHAAQAIAHALQKDRKDRTLSARDFVAELTQQALSAPIVSPVSMAASVADLTPSMISGVTATPGLGNKNPPAVAVAAIPLAKTFDESPKPRSTAWLWAVLGILVLAGAGPMAWRLTRPPEPTLRAPGGEAVKPRLSERAADGREATVGVDASVAALPEFAPDASVAMAKNPARLPPKVNALLEAAVTRAEDVETLNEMRSELSAKRFKEIWSRRSTYEIRLVSQPGKREGLLVILEAGCALREPSVTAVFNQLSAFAPREQIRARRACKQLWPDRDL
jgi:serine/threonine protein kinase